VKRGEAAVLAALVLLAGVALVRAALHHPAEHETDIPFYSTADAPTAQAAGDLIRREGCRSCHSLWTLRDMMQAVPAPMLDGMGALRDEAWLYAYFSSPDPQSVLRSRLKREYRMPSYARLPEPERRLLARYLASLQVKDWYLAETRRLEQEKLTGAAPAEASGAAR
jgi:sulfur-oxidizing protein SoxX